MDNFNFNISLSILNHLGRNLYRNFITVLGEAISNSWDADATNVWIDIDKEHRFMSIIDDGCGMDHNGFQNKFLKIGYSKRRNNNIKSPLGRPYIGRKGIGKLALLSCASKVHIATKTTTSEIVGGVIDNSELDKAITDDINSQDYHLQQVSQVVMDKLNNLLSGTVICFEKITDDIVNTIDYIKKAIALSFKFSLLDNSFNIYVNGEKISCEQLKDLAHKTEFVWIINNFTEPFLEHEISEISPKNIIYKNSDLPIKGYIATTVKPGDIKIRGTNEKVTLDLLVNGRIREKDLLKHMPTARIVESYTFGQIYNDALDIGTGKDIFTSSREGIISNDPDFQKVIDEISKIYHQVIQEWDELRRANGADGDPDNTSISPKRRKATELFNATLKDIKGDLKLPRKGSLVNEWAIALGKEAEFNIPCYTECFISENLLRKYIELKNVALSDSAIKEVTKWRGTESLNKNAANISYKVRQDDKDIFYLDMGCLANLIDKVPADKPKNAGLSRSATVYKPLRDAVGHTSLLTDLAKNQLDLEYENIKARLAILLEEVNKNT